MDLGGSDGVGELKRPSVDVNSSALYGVFEIPVGEGQTNSYDPDILSVTAYNVLELAIYLTLHPMVEIIGFATNSINLRVFWSMGLRDVSTFCFFSLSLSDLCFLLGRHLFAIFCLLNRLEFQSWVRFDQLSYFVAPYTEWFCAVSTLITTYIAVQRCCCVALPLKVKRMFTPRRNAATVVFLALLGTCMFAPWLSNRSVGLRTNSLDNSSWLGLSLTAAHEEVLKVTDYIAFLFLPIAAQAVNVICMVILITSLRRSSRFRNTTTMAINEKKSSEVKDKTKSKERQAVKAVTYVTLIFVISNVMPIGRGLVRRFLPEFRAYKSLRKSFLTVGMIRSFIQQLSASVNILIYYRFNSLFRKKMNSIFFPRPKTDSNRQEQI